MLRKGNLGKFEANIISEIEKATLSKIGMPAFDINPYFHKFFELILFTKIHYCMHYCIDLILVHIPCQ